MSFVTTQPEALMTAAGTLQIIGSGMAAQNAAAAAPTTGVVPAAADEVSALQATQFSAYGTWYQQVSAEATAVHQMLVNTLGTSAGSYGQTEAANQATTGSTSLSGLLGGLTGSGRSSSGPTTLLSSVNAAAAAPAQAAPTGPTTSTGSIVGTPIEWFQNTGAAASDFIALGQGQYLPGAASWDPPGTEASAAFGLTDGAGATLPSAAGSAGVTPPPVAASVGQASSLGRLSVPPSWATGDVPVASATPATLAGTGWTVPATQTAPVTAMPAGMPALASAAGGGLGLSAPRYGVKPTVMPKSVVG